MTEYLDRIKIEGVVFKKGKDEDVEPKVFTNFTPRKQKGKTISGAAKMKAAYKTRKKTTGGRPKR